MKINTLENFIKDNYWNEEYEEARKNVATFFQFSVIVEGAIVEYSMAIDWCIKNIGIRNTNLRKFYENAEQENIKNGQWTEIWYDKIGYDYGFSEFFFKNEEDLKKFKSEISNFYGVEPQTNKKWKTNGYNNFIDLE